MMPDTINRSDLRNNPKDSGDSPQHSSPWRSIGRIMIGIVIAASVIPVAITGYKIGGIWGDVYTLTPASVALIVGFIRRAYVARLRAMPIPKSEGDGFIVKATLPSFLQQR
jgi:hypothetical protein